jgi:tetratricopeptide (TPR) repeat protein
VTISSNAQPRSPTPGGRTPARSPDHTEPTAPGPALATSILSEAQADRVLIQDYCPLADSIEWNLGQRYLHERGSGAFLGDASPVPYVINNDGTLSRHAAHVAFAAARAADQAGTLERDIFVLELGLGVGLFARFFLDTFRDLCDQHGKDYYDRLTYLAGDRSAAMLQDACRHGVFRHHPGRYLLRLLDALQPESALLADAALAGHGPRPLRGVFLNYLLDCLPAAVLHIQDSGTQQLCVRTCLARGADLEPYTTLSPEQLQLRAQVNDAPAQRDLLEAYGLFASEYDYHPVDLATIPYGDFAAAFARTRFRHVLHNHGALRCLERLLALVRPDGFILANDYGQTLSAPAEDYEHQRFSHATFTGVNFPLLKAYFAEGQRCRWEEPPGDNESLHSRLLSPQPASETVLAFHERFGKPAADHALQPLQQARQWAQYGRFEAAATHYARALERQPGNWVLLNEVALFLIFSLRNPKAGIEMAKVALSLNPTCSTELWNTLGDGLYEYGRTEEARCAYRAALRINAGDVRAHYNLAWVHTRQKDYAAALEEIAAGLALDASGEYRERLLQKQSEVLGRLAQQQQQDALRLANRVSSAAHAPARKPEPP